MISKQEIMDFAWEFSLRPEVVEKDYVLGWLLAGIHQSPLAEHWIFKGGTSIKKCYFETFRFSEDLDFTLISQAHIDENFLTETFIKVAFWIYDEAGIEIPSETIKFELYQNKNGKISIEGRIGYIGPLQRRGSFPRVKFDLTGDEILVLQPVVREVHHPYSDKPTDGIKVHCYNFAEIFAEKIRALAQRASPRDLYDVVHLYRHLGGNINSEIIFQILKEKCLFKKITIPTMENIELHEKIEELKMSWKSMLGHQLPILPPFESFWQELPQIFNWLYGIKVLDVYPLFPSDDQSVDSSWQPPTMIQAWHKHVPIELIRYAGTNYLCLELGYEGMKRIVEPYELKRAMSGDLILVAMQHASKEWHVYRLDYIQSIKLTTDTFVPQYQVSLTPLALK